MNFPTSPRSELLTWAQSHAPTWASNAALIGLTSTQATAYTAAVTAYAAAALAQENAKFAARTATSQAAEAFAELRSLTGERVNTIRAFAQSSAKPSTVYNLAQLPVPAPPSPAPSPAQPTDLSVELNGATGSLTLRWKATNPTGTSGTSYIIRRKLPGEGGFGFLGVTGTKRFTDGTLIAGPDSVQYTIQGQRADLSGPVSEIFTVNFGIAPGGGMMAMVTGETEPRLAA